MRQNMNGLSDRYEAEYKAWNAAKHRCHNPKNKAFKRYGERGIKMCDEWRNDFSKFIKDMGPRPDGMSLDRINNDGNYDPLNCRWTTCKTQSLNRSDNKYIKLGSYNLSVKQWSEILSVSHSSISYRLNTGWTMKEIYSHYMAKKTGIGNKRCSKCNKLKDIRLFIKDHREKWGRGAMCKSCHNEYRLNMAPEENIQAIWNHQGANHA